MILLITELRPNTESKYTLLKWSQAIFRIQGLRMGSTDHPRQHSRGLQNWSNSKDSTWNTYLFLRWLNPRTELKQCIELDGCFRMPYCITCRHSELEIKTFCCSDLVAVWALDIILGHRILKSWKPEQLPVQTYIQQRKPMRALTSHASTQSQKQHTQTSTFTKGPN